MSEHIHAVHPEPDMVQLLTPEGQRVEHPDYSLDISDDEIASLYRDLVLVRRIDTEASSASGRACSGRRPPRSAPAGPSGNRTCRSRPTASTASPGAARSTR
jgi:hypothetical protein